MTAAYAAVEKEEFLAHARECAGLGLWALRDGYYNSLTGRGCLIGLGAVVAGRMIGDEGLEALTPFQDAPAFYAAAEERLGIPPDLCRALDFLYMAAPGEERAAELALAFYEMAPEGADLSEAARLYEGGIAALADSGEDYDWADRADTMLAAVVAAGE